MNSAELRAVQAPLKTRYREHPEEALVTLRARARLDQAAVACRVETGQAMVQAGLHPATGGDGLAEKLLSLTERYCVVYQTLRQPPVVRLL